MNYQSKDKLLYKCTLNMFSKKDIPLIWHSPHLACVLWVLLLKQTLFWTTHFFHLFLSSCLSRFLLEWDKHVRQQYFFWLSLDFCSQQEVRCCLYFFSLDELTHLCFPLSSSGIQGMLWPLCVYCGVCSMFMIYPNDQTSTHRISSLHTSKYIISLLHRTRLCFV